MLLIFSPLFPKEAENNSCQMTISNIGVHPFGIKLAQHSGTAEVPEVQVTAARLTSCSLLFFDDER